MCFCNSSNKIPSCPNSFCRSCSQMRLVHREAKLFPLAKSLASSSQTVAAPKSSGQYFKRESSRGKTKSTQTDRFKCLKLELLSRFELETSSLPTAIAIFFTYFPLVYSRFCSFLFAFRHSLKTAFPCVPRLSVAVYVVRNPCGT